MKRIFTLLLFLCFSGLCLSQQYTLTGKVVDEESGEVLSSTYIEVYSDSTLVKAFTANADGAFSVGLPEGTYRLECKFFSYEKTSQIVELTQDMDIAIPMASNAVSLKTVDVTAKGSREHVESTDMGKVEMSMEDIENLPAFFGEVDVMKSIQLLPGVQSGGDGNAGLFVRGSGPDQNLVLLDKATLYNTGHLFGFFSVFNQDAINDFTLYKGAAPAHYGGRLSSVVDFSTREGDMNKYNVKGGIGFIASRLTIDGPVKKDKASFLISGRRTYIDVLSRPFVDESQSPAGVPYYFYDLNGKFDWKISDKSRLEWTGYYGKDRLDFELPNDRFEALIAWSNAASSLHWQHEINDSLLIDVYGIYNRFGFVGEARVENLGTEVASTVNDYELKADATYFLKDHTIKTGVSLGYHSYTPRSYQAQTTDEGNVALTGEGVNVQKYARNSDVHLSDKWEIADWVEVHGGLRLSSFTHIGPYSHIEQDDQKGGNDTIRYNAFEAIKSYYALEPRLMLRFTVDSNSSIKAAFSRNAQYNHLLSLSGNPLPFDVWVPASVLLPTQRGNQYSAGYFRNFFDGQLETSVELYYRDMTSLSAYREDYVPALTGEVERDLVRGTGQAYGLELFLHKQKGDLQGWLGYTLARSTRTFSDINDGDPFPYRFDRRHDLSFALTYQLNDRWSFGSNFVYSTGMAVTMQQSLYFIEGSPVGQYGKRNNFRMPAYHRLDLSASYKHTIRNKIDSEWVFSIYNVYSRKNAFFIYAQPEGSPGDGSLSIKGKKLYLFPILPSVTWNFEF